MHTPKKTDFVLILTKQNILNQSVGVGDAANTGINV